MAMTDPSQLEHEKGSVLESQKSLDEELGDLTLDSSECELSGKQMDRKIGRLIVSPHFMEMQCPFSWEECNSLDGAIWEGKLLEILEFPESEGLHFYCYEMLLGCLYGRMDKEEDALKNFRTCEELLENQADELFYKAIVPGLKHVLNACRCHLYIVVGKVTIAADISSSVQPFEELDNQSKAAVWAVKATVLHQFGPDGKRKAYECIKMAIELDPDEDGSRRGAWYYYAGKLMGEIRRMVSREEMPSKEELKYLERSTAINPFPLHYAALADSYRTSSSLVLKKFKNFTMANKLSEQSLNLYRKALEGNCTNFLTLKRCASGLTRLPKKYRDINLAEHCLKQAVDMFPKDPDLYMMFGDIEEWHRNDRKAALKYFEKARECGHDLAGLRIIKVKYDLDKSYNPIHDCDMFISQIGESTNYDRMLKKKSLFLAVKVEYYLNIKKDVLAAAQEWEKALDSNEVYRVLKEYECQISRGPSTTRKLCEDLRQSIMNALRSSDIGETETACLRRLLRILEEETDNS